VSRKARQKLWWSVHWWVGLWAGYVFALSGLTGRALVSYLAIDEWLNPERLTPLGSGLYWSFGKLSGLAGAFVLLLLGGTCVYMEFPEYIVPLVRLDISVPEGPELYSTIDSDSTPISIDRAVIIAKDVFPDEFCTRRPLCHGVAHVVAETACPSTKKQPRMLE